MVHLNPLAIFHNLGQSTRVDAHLAVLPDELERESYTRVTGVPPLTPRTLRKDVLPRKFAISIDSLREMRRWVGSLVFSEVVIVCVQEMYLKELSRGAKCAFGDMKRATVRDTSLCHKAWPGPTSFEAWRDTWAQFKGGDKESTWRVCDSPRFTELHRALAPAAARGRAEACTECPVCYGAAEVFASCGHGLCTECRSKWKSLSCPTCRAETSLWYSSRVTTLSVLKHALARWPSHRVVFLDLSPVKSQVDRTIRVLNLENLEGVGEIESRVSGFDCLTKAAAACARNTVIVVSGSKADKAKIDFTIKYLRSISEDGNRLPVFICLNEYAPTDRKRKRRET